MKAPTLQDAIWLLLFRERNAELVLCLHRHSPGMMCRTNTMQRSNFNNAVEHKENLHAHTHIHKYRHIYSNMLLLRKDLVDKHYAWPKRHALRAIQYLNQFLQSCIHQFETAKKRLLKPVTCTG